MERLSVLLTGRRGLASMQNDLQLNVDLLLHLFGRIAQLVRALPLQGRGHRFDPCSAYHVFATPLFSGAVVQPGLGRQIVNLEVAGSNPVGPAIFFCAPLDGAGRHSREGEGALRT